MNRYRLVVPIAGQHNREGSTNEEEFAFELAAADGNKPCSSNPSISLFPRLWLNFVKEYVAHAWWHDRTLFAKG
jgi:hypothetical protein